MILNVRLHQTEDSPLGILARNTRMRTLHVYPAQHAVQRWFSRATVLQLSSAPQLSDRELDISGRLSGAILAAQL